MSRRERANMVKYIHWILGLDLQQLATWPDQDLEYVYEKVLLPQTPDMQ